jgi:hypothetical protein
METTKVGAMSKRRKTCHDGIPFKGSGNALDKK